MNESQACLYNNPSYTGSVKIKGVFSNFTCGSSLYGALKQGGIPDWTNGSSTHGRCLTCGSSTHRILKTGKYFKLDTLLLSAHVDRVKMWHNGAPYPNIYLNHQQKTTGSASDNI